MESILSMRITGVEVLVVDFKGNARFRPQSPLASDDCVVSIAACVGYGVVAVSELKFEIAERSGVGRGRGGGREKSLDVLRRFAVGDNFRKDIVHLSIDKGDQGLMSIVDGLSRYSLVRERLTMSGPLPGE